ncbi:hypothetical protein [Prevotella multiformis]|uniref:hypothetical protein n=1 Tax=Prevotella multiformis TaxID=282402 RepID=UPI0023F54BD0|nr:hypothetical protein [Prevotella multiformis]
MKRILLAMAAALLTANAAGLFSKNPLLKLMFLGFGGMNLLNNAGHEMLGVPEPSAPRRNYKQYDDEPLNPRLNNVALRGRSLIADIDNQPVVINISDTAVDAFEKSPTFEHACKCCVKKV